MLILGPPGSPYFEAAKQSEEIASTLRGGSVIVSHILLNLRETAIEEPAFPIKARAQYRNRVGEEY